MFDPEHYQTRETVISMTNAVLPVCANNSSRVYLAFSSGAAGGIRVSIRGNVTTNDGYLITTTFNAQEFWWSKSASLVTMPWFAIGGFGALLTVTEVWRLEN